VNATLIFAEDKTDVHDEIDAPNAWVSCNETVNQRSKQKTLNKISAFSCFEIHDLRFEKILS